MKVNTERKLNKIANFAFNLLMSFLIIIIVGGSIWMAVMMLVGYFSEEGEAARIARQNAEMRYFPVIERDYRVE